MVDIDRVLLGDNPFIGVDHLSQERAREKTSVLDTKSIASIIEVALCSGAQGFVCSAHPNNKNALNFMHHIGSSRKFGVYLIVPDAQTYLRLASEKGMLGLLNETLGKLTFKGKARAMIGGGLSALTANPMKMLRTYLKAETLLLESNLPANAKLKSLFLHELLTELIVSLELRDLAKEHVEFVRDSLGVVPGFVTRNFARFVDFAISSGILLEEIAIMSPFNKAGFQMSPSKELCERKLGEATNVNLVAMSILAGGYCKLDEAIDYISKLKGRVSCVVGVSTEKHAMETFSKLRFSLSPS